VTTTLTTTTSSNGNHRRTSAGPHPRTTSPASAFATSEKWMVGPSSSSARPFSSLHGARQRRPRRRWRDRLRRPLTHSAPALDQAATRKATQAGHAVARTPRPGEAGLAAVRPTSPIRSGRIPAVVHAQLHGAPLARGGCASSPVVATQITIWGRVIAKSHYSSLAFVT
jgi:hypothetical protein